MNRLVLSLLLTIAFSVPSYAQSPLSKVVVTYSSTSLQNGLGVLVKNVKDPLVKKILRARAKGNRYSHHNEMGTAEILAKYLNVDDLHTALETYQISRSAFTTNGIPTDAESTEYLKEDAQILGLPAPVPVAKVFDFPCSAKSIASWGSNE